MLHRPSATSVKLSRTSSHTTDIKCKSYINTKRRHVVTIRCSAAVGIDLGTTNSAVAILRKGETFPSIVTDVNGAFTVPSIVSYDAAGTILVGQQAKAQAVTNPLNTFYSVKRLIGRQVSKIQDLDLVYNVQEDEQGGVQLDCPATAQTFTPQQVSAELLKHLLQLASQHLGGETPQQVVITVPAYFDEAQRAATLEAAKLAGIAKVSLLQEPVAAAMAFGFGKPYDAETLLVFDLGGGTFDLSVVDSFEGIMEVLSTNGDSRLGGDDFDIALVAWVLQQLQQLGSGGGSSADHSFSIESLNPEVLAKLLEAVEAAKCRLTLEQETTITLDSDTCAAVAAGAATTPILQQQQEEVAVQLSRQQMHDATAQLRQRLWQPLQQLAHDCKLEYEMLPSHIEQHLAAAAAAVDGLQDDHNSSSSSDGSSSQGSTPVDKYAPKPRKLTAVLLVGGATRMPIIQQGLQKLTGLKPRSEIDPEQAVALGAAVQAAVLMGLSSGLEVMDGSYVEEQHNRSTGFV